MLLLSGRARLAISRKCKNYFVCYLLIRDAYLKLHDKSCDRIFMDPKCNPLNSSGVNTALRRLQSHSNLPRYYTPTFIRKCICTQLSLHQNEISEEYLKDETCIPRKLSKALLHSESVSKQFYNIFDRDSNATTCHRIIRDFYTLP